MDSDMMEDDESGEDFNDLDLDAEENMSAEIDSDEVDSDSDEGKAALKKVTDIRKKQQSKPVEVSDDDSSDEEYLPAIYETSTEGYSSDECERVEI